MLLCLVAKPEVELGILKAKVFILFNINLNDLLLDILINLLIIVIN